MKAKTVRRLSVAGLAMVLAACGEGDLSSLSGKELATEVGCFACHTEADSDLAPTLHGIWGTQVTFEDGTTTTVDEAYVRKSITDPSTQIVAGYDGRMPTFGLSDDEVDRLVDYVRSLS
jgi:cytochrome c oxidase subunit 2